MFTEMKSMLNVNLNTAGHVTATRALNRFSERILRSDALPSNHSQLMEELVSDTTALLNTVKAASSNKLSASAEVSHLTSSSLHRFNQILDTRNYRLGVYRSSAQTQKEILHTLSPALNPITTVKDEIQKTAARAVLLDLDRSWWTIREKLDAYLDIAENQNSAFTNAITVLEVPNFTRP